MLNCILPLGPSQTLFLDMQPYLQDRSASCFVLPDLAKAFERVDPHWILLVLQHLGMPAWAYQYATYVLFGRSVRHRVGRYYRPPLPVRQGFDMGRAVLVLLFCVAMDPVYVNLNMILRVISVKGYMDDNATCGEGVSWLAETQRAFTSQPISDQTPITTGGPSLRRAIEALPDCGDVVLGCASRRAYLSRNDVPDFCSGHPTLQEIWQHMLTVECKCKCKTHLLSSRSIDCAELCAADDTPWGARVLSSEAVMLGLPLHGQAQFGVTLPKVKIDAKPHATCAARLRIMRHLNLSVRERGMFCAFYLQSTYAYAYSVQWPTKEAMRQHRRMLSRAFYPARAWIDMRALPLNPLNTTRKQGQRVFQRQAE